MEKDLKKIDTNKKPAANPSKAADLKRGAKAVKPAAKKEGAKKSAVSEVRASARFIQMSPKKVRLVTNLLADRPAENALNYLRFVNKAAVLPVSKLIKSAVANGENNFNIDKDYLYIKQILVNDGPVLKRWQPRAHGRSTPIRKRTCHIMLVLGVRPGAAKKAVAAKPSAEKVAVEADEVKIVKPDEVKKDLPKSSGKGPDQKGKNQKGFFKGFFQRKTG